MTETKEWFTAPPRGMQDRRGLAAAAEKVRASPGVWLLLEEATPASHLGYLYRRNGVRRPPALRDTDEWIYDVTTRSLRDGTNRYDVYVRARRRDH